MDQKLNELGGRSGPSNDHVSAPPRHVSIGIVSLILIIIAAFAFSARFTPDVFITWVSLIWMSAVPAQIISALFLNFEHPRIFATLAQPFKGLVFFVGTAFVALLITAVIITFAGTNLMLPPPMLIMYAILSIAVTFWWLIIWGGWPFSADSTHPVLSAAALLVGIYALTLAIFCVFFDFGFLKGAPVYVSALDPQGLLSAWTPLVFAVTSVAVLLLFVQLDFWPVTILSGGARQAIFGLWAFAIIVPIAAIIQYVVTMALDIDGIAFLLHGPIAYIFGFLIVGQLMQNKSFVQKVQPMRGVLLAATGFASGSITVLAYRIAAPWLSGAPLAAGGPAYALELWTATALLAVTFPLITAFAGGAAFWPLVRGGR